MITIVGTGIRPDDLTAAGERALKAAAIVVSRHKTAFGAVALADRHKDAADFNALDERITDEILAFEREHGSVAFAVRGDGYTDTAAARLVRLRPDCVVVPGVAVCAGRTPGTALVSLSGYDLGRDFMPDTSLPLLLYAVENRMVAGECKLRLLEFYPAERIVQFTAGGKTRQIELHELDKQPSYIEGSVFLPAYDGFLDKTRFTFADLMAVMNRLTDPDGCPWDKAQTHDSIRINLIEEAYEAVDALGSGDIDDAVEELGDILLQAVFHANIGERTGEYTTGDILSALCRKLITRHTHIFGAVEANNADEALTAWEAAKAVEKQYDSLCGQLERLPANFPAALVLQKTVKKAVKAGARLTTDEVRSKLTDALDVNDAARVLQLSVIHATLCGLSPEIVLADYAAALKHMLAQAEADGNIEDGLKQV